MDYGKMAYMKAEELEARIKTPAPSTAASVGFAPDAPAKDLPLTAVKLSGSAIVLVKTTLYSRESVEATMTLYIDGMAAADATVRLTADVPHTEILMGCVNINGAAALRLDCDDGRVLAKRVEVGLIGTAAGVTREASDFRLAYSAAGTAAAVASSSVITAYPVTEAIGEGKSLCRGRAFDLCATDDGYALVNNDLAGNLWLRRLSPALDTLSCVRLCDALDSPTVACFDGRLYVAAVRDGQAYVFNAAENAVRFPVPFVGTVDSVHFVKNAPRPILAIGSGGKVFLKTAVDRALGGFSVRVTPSIAAVSDWGDEYQWN